MEQKPNQKEPGKIQGVEGPPFPKEETGRQQLGEMLKRTRTGGIPLSTMWKRSLIDKVRPFLTLSSTALPIQRAVGRAETG